MSNKSYTIEYKEYDVAKVEYITVLAPNKEDAYYKGYDMITDKLGKLPYSAWVSAVTYQNGNYRYFNNFEGKPY